MRIRVYLHNPYNRLFGRSTTEAYGEYPYQYTKTYWFFTPAADVVVKTQWGGLSAKLVVLWLLKPWGYDDPTSWNMLWNQWVHQGFLWGWYSYDFYSDHTKGVRDDA